MEKNAGKEDGWQLNDVEGLHRLKGRRFAKMLR